MPTVEYRGMNLVIPDNDSEWREHFALARSSQADAPSVSIVPADALPAEHGCPWCASTQWTWREVSGRGHIYSYEIVAHAIQPGFKEWTPYPVVLVELDEQRGTPTEHEALRIIANLVTAGLPSRGGGQRRHRQACAGDLSGHRGRLRAAAVHPHRRAGGGSRLALPRVARAIAFSGTS